MREVESTYTLIHAFDYSSAMIEKIIFKYSAAIRYIPRDSELNKHTPPRTISGAPWHRGSD